MISKEVILQSVRSLERNETSMDGILLIVPREGEYIHREALIPPGIAYINGALRAAGFSVTSCNLNFTEGTVEEILEKLILEHEIGYLLCGGTSFNGKDIRRCFQAARKVKREIWCIGGGAGYTAEPELFCEFTEADIGVLGEGEITQTELLKTLMEGGSLDQVQGIIYKKGEAYVRTPARDVIPDLDMLPFPSYEGLGLEGYFENEKHYESSALFDYSYTKEPRVMPMFLGRSCPFGCKFCFHTIGQKYRVRSFDNFFQELDMWIEKYRINGLLLMDELFGGKEETILEFCRRIKEYHLPWVAEMRVELASRKVLEAMKDAGCTHLQFGLESMCSRVLKDMNKKIIQPQIIQALRDSYELKIHVFGNFIFGAEAEDRESFLETYNWWNRHRKYQIRLLTIMTYPGSQYYKNSVDRGLIQDKVRFLEEGMPAVNMSRMSDFDWDRMRRVIRMTEIDNVFMGRITAIHENQEDLTLEVRCVHCKQTFVVSHVEKEKRLIRRDMLSVCPHCQRNVHYNFDDYRDIMEHEVMSQWICNQSEGADCLAWLKKQGYKTAGIWGKSLLAEFLVKELQGEVSIVCATAKEGEHYSAYSYIGKRIPLVEPEELAGILMDVLIVTEASEYTESCESIRRLGYQGRIDSLVNFVFDMEYHLIIPENCSRKEIMESQDDQELEYLWKE